MKSSLLAKAARWLGLSLALSACSHDYRLMKMDEQLNRYGGMIRWSLFKKSMEYYEQIPSPMPDWKRLSDIKVTYYQPLFRDTLSNGNLILQTVEVRYVHSSDVIERTLTYDQRWRYDEAKDRWLLESGFPQFK